MLQDQIREFLSQHNLMGISTVSENGSIWPAIVYYVFDEELNLYFMSDKKELHSKNINIRKQIACTIYSSDQPSSEDKAGLQLSGIAEEISMIRSIKWMLKMWQSHVDKGSEPLMDPQDFVQLASDRIYKITPKRIKYFNSALFEQNFELLEL